MKYKYQENTYVVRGIPVTIMEKIKVDNNGNEIYDAKVEQENDLKIYKKHKEIILEKLEKGEINVERLLKKKRIIIL